MGGPWFWDTRDHVIQFFGMGHPDNTCQLVFIDGHAEAMTHDDVADEWDAIREASSNYWSWDVLFHGKRRPEVSIYSY